MLEVRALSKEFGGVHAVHDVSFQVERGTIHAIIGPNGAGKTTLFNLISGLYVPTAGTIRLEGRDVTAMSPERLARAGLSRTFQNLQVCPTMSARENVMLGAHLRSRSSVLGGLLGLWQRHERALSDAARALLERVGVPQGDYESPASDLSFGVLKRIEIARALANAPKIVLLDEPAAGLNDSETRDLSQLIRSIADAGITVLLVEHDMKMVMNLSHRITVLNHGSLLAEGSPDGIRNHPAVIEAYLGH